MTALPAHGHVTAAAVAQHLGMTPAWVRRNAARLGGHRFGTAYRFDVHRVRAAIDQARIPVEPERSRRRPGPKRGVGGRAIPADVKDW